MEAGVIGRIVDDFNPQLIFHLFYGNRHISSGDEVLLGDLGESPHDIGFNIDPDRPDLREYFKNRTILTLVNPIAISSLLFPDTYLVIFAPIEIRILLFSYIYNQIMTDPDGPRGEYLHWYVVIICNSDQISDRIS